MASRPSPSAARPLRSSSGSLPPPPNMGRPLHSVSAPQTMTIDEMRLVHKRALSEAEAKRTELRLVLASRYRELVGSSDEVLKMGERAKELHELVHALPSLVDKLVQSSTLAADSPSVIETETQEEESEAERLIKLRRSLSQLPRDVHRALDKKHVHQAATSLIELFGIIASHTDEYPLANALSDVRLAENKEPMDPLLAKQMKMTYLFVEGLPVKTKRLAKLVLQTSAADSGTSDVMGARQTAAALSTLKVLDVKRTNENATDLLDLYFESKAKLLQNLLAQLATSDGVAATSNDKDVDAENAEDVLSKIVLILQYDVILYPYLVFCKRNFPAESALEVDSIMATMPTYDTSIITAKVSHFLATHLPLIRTKAKSILVNIAGTTASALGKIRQSLYDKTDGVDCIEALDSNGIATWEEAVSAMVDLRIVHSHASSQADATSKISGQRKFSLWSALFSNTFSSLVHSLLTTSFHSVHARVVSSLRTSLANAPPFSAMLPHEAYRNTLRIATELDAALLKVSDDAHELLVHAEEREESERRLRQSLYVQTCEIMGRLICELRRMLFRKSKTDGTKEFIVGRLCHLLKFRLTSLPTLLNPSSSPAALHGSTSGMITLYELQSAFELADDNDDGLINFQEAMESVDSAFSGTQFHGAEMVRETLLLGAKAEESPSTNLAVPSNVTLNELTLLSARGLRHEKSGPHSALGTIQSSLDDIISTCFSEWASVALESSNESYRSGLVAFLDTARSTDEAEWQRIHCPTETSSSLQELGGTPHEIGSNVLAAPVVENVSPYVVGYMESLSSILSRSVCPSDSMKPVPSTEYAKTLGIATESDQDIPSLMDTIRWTILNKAVVSVASISNDEITSALSPSDGGEDEQQTSLKNSGPSALIQLDVDIGFVLLCFFERNLYGFGDGDVSEEIESARMSLSKQLSTTEQLLRIAYSGNAASLRPSIEGRHRHVLEVCDLFLSVLFGEDAAARSLAGEVDVTVDISSGGSSATPLFHPPLQSSRRFVLLPIQTDRSISELQRRGKLGKDKDVGSDREEAGAGVIGSGLGFFSSMLKKK